DDAVTHPPVEASSPEPESAWSGRPTHPDPSAESSAVVETNSQPVESLPVEPQSSELVPSEPQPVTPEFSEVVPAAPAVEHALEIVRGETQHERSQDLVGSEPVASSAPPAEGAATPGTPELTLKPKTWEEARDAAMVVTPILDP